MLRVLGEDSLSSGLAPFLSCLCALCVRLFLHCTCPPSLARLPYSSPLHFFTPLMSVHGSTLAFTPYVHVIHYSINVFTLHFQLLIPYRSQLITVTNIQHHRRYFLIKLGRASTIVLHQAFLGY